MQTFSIQTGTLVSSSSARAIAGASLSNGASEAGKLWRQPSCSVREIRNVWNGPGCMPAAKPRVMPSAMYEIKSVAAFGRVQIVATVLREGKRHQDTTTTDGVEVASASLMYTEW